MKIGASQMGFRMLVVQRLPIRISIDPLTPFRAGIHLDDHRHARTQARCQRLIGGRGDAVMRLR